jgi:hypothetical protein
VNRFGSIPLLKRQPSGHPLSMTSSWYSREKLFAYTSIENAKESLAIMIPTSVASSSVNATSSFLLDCLELVDSKKLNVRTIFSLEPNAKPLTTSRLEWMAEISNQKFKTTSGEHRLTEYTRNLGMVIVDGHLAIMVFETEMNTGSFIQIFEDESVAGIQDLFDSIWISSEPNISQLLHTSLLEGILPNQIVTSCNQIWSDVIPKLNQNPETLFAIHPRQFEQLIAHLFDDRGYSVELTPQSRDGGRDVIVRAQTGFGDLLFLVECKRNRPNRPVSVGLVRSLLGVVEDEEATMGVLITTSSFTKNALELGERHKYRLKLKDFEHIKKWLSEYGRGQKGL